MILFLIICIIVINGDKFEAHSWLKIQLLTKAMCVYALLCHAKGV